MEILELKSTINKMKNETFPKWAQKQIGRKANQ